MIVANRLDLCDADCIALHKEQWLVPLSNGDFGLLAFCQHHADEHRDSYETFVNQALEPAVDEALETAG